MNVTMSLQEYESFKHDRKELRELREENASWKRRCQEMAAILNASKTSQTSDSAGAGAGEKAQAQPDAPQATAHPCQCYACKTARGEPTAPGDLLAYMLGLQG